MNPFKAMAAAADGIKRDNIPKVFEAGSKCEESRSAYSADAAMIDKRVGAQLAIARW